MGKANIEEGIDPGQFDRRILWEAKTQSPVPSQMMSDPPSAYSQGVPLWAEVKALRGNEQINARQVKAETWYRVRIRNSPAISKQDRFDFNGIKLNISSSYSIGVRGAYTECLCIAQG